MKGRAAWTDGDKLFVIRSGRTTNAKIAEAKEQVVQTYTFDVRQLALVRSALKRNSSWYWRTLIKSWRTLTLSGPQDGKTKVDRKTFYSLDGANCMDCPLSGNSGTGKCYTHKYMQFSGFLSMLKSLCKEEIPQGLSEQMRSKIQFMCMGADLIRFGTYGEPSLLPLGLVEEMTNVGSTPWTGYTHQARKPWAQPYKKFFMASAHSDKDAESMTGWRSFVCVDKGDTSTGVQCPASKELSVSTCSACGLCSGILGKGSKDVQIQMH
tara:strand:+ start:608 stop:1405 length:798 start_codon:yes stop_codon:yes gene_type:complete